MNYELSVDIHDLIAGLKRFRLRRKIRPTEKAILAFDGRFCSIEALDTVIVANATGVWPGIARFSASVIVALVKFPPANDPFIVSLDGDRLKLGSLNIGCEWQPVSHTLSKLPAAPDWVQALSLKYRATRGQILSEGLEEEIAQAERKLAMLITRITKSLSPLGVSENDIRSLVENRLAERYSQ